MPRILVTSAGGALAPLNIKLLQASRHDVSVVAVDARADALGQHFADVFATVPPGNSPEYVDAVRDLVTRHHVDVVLPWSDEEALSLANRRGEIESLGVVLACAEASTLQVMASKAATLSLLAKAGVRVPRWQIVSSAEEMDAALQAFRTTDGEAVVKPISSRGSRDVYVIRKDISGETDYFGSRETHVGWDAFDRDHRTVVATQLPAIVMERLHAPAYDLDILARKGRLLRMATRERINPAGVPFRGSIFRSGRTFEALGEKVTAALNLSWLYDYDLMTASDGEPVVIEVNPRPSGSIAASIRAGMPFYDDLFDLIAGRSLQSDWRKPADGTLFVPYLDCGLSGRGDA